MLEQRLRNLGQDHIARLLNSEGSPATRQKIVRDLEGVDLELVNSLILAKGLYCPTGREVEPADVTPATFASSKEAVASIEQGRELLSRGKVAALVVAGGQGSRLGIDAPKGVVGVTPVEGKSLFHLFAEKILALKNRFGHAIPWFIMTSRENDAHTREYFRENGYFGLNNGEIHFFVQGMLPSITEDGKFIIAGNGGLFMNPDGHGGTFMALRRSGSLGMMKDLGIEEIFYFQVDNPLVKVCDPLFIGLHSLNRAQMSSKVVRKTTFEENVGVITRQGDKTLLLEYSDLDDAVRYARDAAGNILHWAGSIAIHVIRRDFVESITEHGSLLPFHRARKRITVSDASGNVTEIEGIKFETFLFDALPLADRSITLEVLREEEFAPVKNLTGVDSLESSRHMQTSLYVSWLNRLGIEVGNGISVEFSPLFALDFEELNLKAALLPRAIEKDTYFG